jgi:hypothetical protein
MRNLASAIALVMLCACAGYTSGPVVVGGTPTGGGTLDGGGDAGVGDAGIDGGPDAGCVPLTLNSAAIDNCPSGGVALTGTTAIVNVTPPDAGNGACAVTIQINSGSNPCIGVASHGANDAFSGVCQGTGLNCTSPSVPGLLTCTNGTGGCTITICPGTTVDGGVCGP